jgi:DMSO/TMAO reductase YedYZ molybdopterin-dependent catalytic subunit
VLDLARPTAEARFVVFHCMDTIERSLSGLVKYYESIDMRDAVHPQTILAYGLNDAALPVANGAPLRVRVERQLGYKMAKYLHTIELVAGVEGFGDGNGSYWADRGYDWYAGI